MRPTALNKLHGVCRRIKAWIESNRCEPGSKSIRGLNHRLFGRCNGYGPRGNSRSSWRFYPWAMECASKWLNLRGGTRRRFIWSVFTHARLKVDIDKPRITELSDSRRISR